MNKMVIVIAALLLVICCGPHNATRSFARPKSPRDRQSTSDLPISSRAFVARTRRASTLLLETK